VLLSIAGLTSFRVHLQSGQGVAVAVEAEFGFFAFVWATILVLIVGNVLLMLHRRAHEAELDEPILRPSSRLRVCCRTRKAALVVFIMSFLAAMFLVVAGAFLRLCTIEVEGVVGWFLDFLQQYDDEVRTARGEVVKATSAPGNVLHFSMVSLGLRMHDVAVGTPYYATLFLQACYFSFCFLAPCFFLVKGVGMAARALLGNRASEKQHLWTMAHTLFSWCAVDVYIIGFLVTIAEFGHATPVDPRLDRWARDYLSNFLDLPGRDTMVGLRASVHPGAWLLLAGALLQFPAGLLFLRSLGWLQGLEDPSGKRSDSGSSSGDFDDGDGDSDEEKADDTSSGSWPERART